MKKHTFTIFNAIDNTVDSYLFDVTREDVQKIVTEMNRSTGNAFYYMDGYLED